MGLKPVAVIIPTFRRPESLERALRSIFAQDGLDGLVEDVVVVDNDTQASARAVVEAVRDACPVRLVYVHALIPGVSNARNAGLSASAAPLIAFLDDDEAAPADWLANLYAIHVAFDEDVTFGPVRGRADQAAAWKRRYLERFFSRTGPDDSGPIDAAYGCGNAMLTRATTLVGPRPFAIEANETGGEDDRLFQHLRAAGRRFAWASEAFVWEHALPARQTVRYALTRAFGYGQSPAQIAAREGRWLIVAGWMAVGAAQGAGFAALALAAAPVSRGAALSLADRAARGFGKLGWFATLRFYGRAAARATSPRASRNAMAEKISHITSL